MIARRRFLALAVATVAAHRLATAQTRGKVWRLGYLALAPLTDPPSPERSAFVAALREAGYAAGDNLVVEYRSAESDRERLPFLADELVKAKVDVIVVPSVDPARAALDATNSVPIVMLGVADPVVFGLVANLARPGANLTGSSWRSVDIIGKRFQLLREVLPRARRVAHLWNPDTMAAAVLPAVQDAARRNGFALEEVPITNVGDLQRGLEAVERRRPDALHVTLDVRLAAYRQLIAQAALDWRVPSVANYKGFVDAGGLMSYAADLAALYRRGAAYVDRILRGAHPADLPIEQPDKFVLALNLGTARAIGLAIPRSVLLRADEVIP
ncbi:MAG: ABC transporter substrate-binding protein [Burkholderiales bacterium]|nr:ABC transporter substrate-binding protein [Burkholderiales bacterium]